MNQINRKSVRAFVAFVAMFALMFTAAGCDKKKTVLSDINKIVRGVNFGLNVVDDATTNGLMSKEDKLQAYTIASSVNYTLTEINGFIQTLPPEVLDGKVPADQTQVQLITKLLADGLQRANRLIDQGALIKDPVKQKNYLSYAQPVLGFLNGLQAIVNNWKKA